MDTVNFFGHECVSLENNKIQLLLSRSIGPRILSLKFTGGENILAELPNFTVDCPGSGSFHVYGGHRLWHSPEIPSRTYQPDDTPVELCPIEDGDGYLATQDVEAKTGIQKSMEIRLLGDVPCIVVTHRLVNHGLWPVTCSPWAITQLRTGGVAILPQSYAETRELPNRSLILWPYTNLSNPNVSFGKHHILVRADMDEPFKVGFPNPRGWLAYWLDGVLFVKRADFDARSDYFDFGSSSECYCNDQFLELETLAPIHTIEPGECVTHVETWNLSKDIDHPRDEKDVQALVQKLGLEK